MACYRRSELTGLWEEEFGRILKADGAGEPKEVEWASLHLFCWENRLVEFRGVDTQNY